jgi:hypothetical protein
MLSQYFDRLGTTEKLLVVNAFQTEALTMIVKQAITELQVDMLNMDMDETPEQFLLSYKLQQVKLEVLEDFQRFINEVNLLAKNMNETSS